MRGRSHTPRRPMHLTQLNVALNAHDAGILKELMQIIDRNHLMTSSRSHAAKLSMAVALHVIKQAEADGTYRELAQVAAEIMQPEDQV